MTCKPNITGTGVVDAAAPATTGLSYPIGATLVAGGANFSVFFRSAAQIELLFFDRADDARPSRVIPIDPLTFELPILKDGKEHWRRWIDTALDPPHDICEWNAEQPVLGTTYRAEPRSVVVLIAGERRIEGVPDGEKHL